MIKHNQSGAVSGMLISLIMAVLLLIGALGFSGWAFSGRQDYKNNVASKVSAAVTVATQKQGATDQAKFNEEAKQPLKTYNGPEAYGSLVVNFPKTWSAYVDDTGTSGTVIDGYFAPGVVPSIGNTSSVFALRVQVLQQGYAQVLQALANQQQVGKLTTTAYALPKVPHSIGIKAVGQLNPQSPTVTMVIVPLRSNTLEIWTQGNQYVSDFNNNILPNFTFSP
jgi:hypothetical protein